jgi:hypothetical protein
MATALSSALNLPINASDIGPPNVTAFVAAFVAPGICDSTMPTAFRRRAISLTSSSVECYSSSNLGHAVAPCPSPDDGTIPSFSPGPAPSPATCTGSGYAGVPKLSASSSASGDPYNRFSSAQDVCPRLAQGRACAFSFQCATGFCCPYLKVCMVDSTTPRWGTDRPFSDLVYPAGFTPDSLGDNVCNPSSNSPVCMECVRGCCTGAGGCQAPNYFCRVATKVGGWDFDEVLPGPDYDLTQCNCHSKFIELFNAGTWVVR